MLVPDKHLNIQLSVFNIAAQIIKMLKERGILTFDELLSILINITDNEGVKEVFIQSLSFLFILNKIDYLKDIDSIVLIDEIK
ncbi:MAG: hypothetical protein L3V56_06080 [Candidatus Magnetoovum sp. WYHC-5]|nr:hypothetical protein [Candidatus Magnetoovum sp. WYHC-5]